eukprot:CAMPEP_0181201294 /NCGR_PEP_ID=MMETSP1096-20121128/18229_1 /TAXON_ID=156174 ORGANISM="Chrysochromulina ericina, Strain CCMP281" /NCGR_SAMPLE_ID=MMETSP1096 /ASSEMBLY_ACC=CAM_ASM_000453 /LENGTH=118 /DNA_ID=CAMNT_0023291725 /DNA_START=550 /DNA_END=906 /DNA_ORIENTATION=+
MHQGAKVEQLQRIVDQMQHRGVRDIRSQECPDAAGLQGAQRADGVSVHCPRPDLPARKADDAEEHKGLMGRAAAHATADRGRQQLVDWRQHRRRQPDPCSKAAEETATTEVANTKENE